jgi:hypothetical protein
MDRHRMRELLIAQAQTKVLQSTLILLHLLSLALELKYQSIRQKHQTS